MSRMESVMIDKCTICRSNARFRFEANSLPFDIGAIRKGILQMRCSAKTRQRFCYNFV